MKLLLDTHIFLWYISGDHHLPMSLRDIIRDSANEVYLSVISLWESIVKYRLGKLPLPLSPEKYLPLQRERHNISSLSLDEAAVVHLSALPFLHRDPFDRMLICPGYRTRHDHGDYGRGYSPVSDKYYPKIIEEGKQIGVLNF